MKVLKERNLKEAIQEVGINTLQDTLHFLIYDLNPSMVFKVKNMVGDHPTLTMLKLANLFSLAKEPTPKEIEEAKRLRFKPVSSSFFQRLRSIHTYKASILPMANTGLYEALEWVLSDKSLINLLFTHSEYDKAKKNY